VKGRRTLLLLGLAFALPCLGADWRTPPPGEGPESIRTRQIGGAEYVPVNDLARILDATRFWRADVRKLVLRAGPHSIVLTLDTPFVLVDDATVRLDRVVRSADGELQVPVDLLRWLPSDSTMARLTFDERRQRVVVLPASGSIGSPKLQVAAGVTRLSFPAEKADEAVVVARSRAHFRLRFGGVFVGTLPDTIPSGALLREIHPITSAGGTAFEARIDPEATGFRLLTDADAGRATLELTTERGAAAGWDRFAPESPPGERRLRMVVLDPGHGGTDRGVIAGDAVEKDLTLALAKLLRVELERQNVRVVLTRTDDRDLPAQARAELANRAQADLVLALHFDGYVDPRARGATAYCPLATVGGSEEEPEPVPARGARTVAASARLSLLPWREVATRHAVQSRALAEAVLSAIELRGLGPTRLRERLPYTFLGVNAPGILLECGTLTSPGDRERLLGPGGLEALASTIAEGVAAYRRNE
jgi:N-acetylmuramoyl-L-alanine amidase